MGDAAGHEADPISAYAEGKLSVDTEVEDLETYEMILAQQESDENAVDENGNLIGEDDSAAASAQASAAAIDTSMEKLSNYEYLLGNFYTVDSSTMADPELINAGKLLGKDLKINESTGGPKVLIYHTHSQETFADSVPGDTSTSILGIGEYLSRLLNDTYGIETLHHQGVYDLINGKLDRSMAYQLAEPEITRILQENPSIEVVIDLHRDGVAEGTHLVTEVNGKPTAQIMFFNGLSRSRANGEISYLANPYIEDNLAIFPADADRGCPEISWFYQTHLSSGLQIQYASGAEDSSRGGRRTDKYGGGDEKCHGGAGRHTRFCTYQIKYV